MINEQAPVHPAHPLDIGTPDDLDPFNLEVSVLFILLRFSLNQPDPGATSAKPHHHDSDGGDGRGLIL
jgi:hypothetical protein